MEYVRESRGLLHSEYCDYTEEACAGNSFDYTENFVRSLLKY